MSSRLLCKSSAPINVPPIGEYPGFWLLPGMNRLPAGWLDAVKALPSSHALRALFRTDNGDATLAAKPDSYPAPDDDTPLFLGAFDETEAVHLIHLQTDRNVLRHWRDDARSTVSVAARARLQELSGAPARGWTAPSVPPERAAMNTELQRAWPQGQV